MEVILIAAGPAFRTGAAPHDAELLDIAPTVLHLLGVPVPDDLDGRVLTELLEPASPLPVLEPALAAAQTNGTHASAFDASYTPEEDAAIQQRLADLGYL
jgi:arylsulfatase A-like enzyme